jgi:hypothetical protein
MLSRDAGPVDLVIDAVVIYYDLRVDVGGQSPMYRASIGWDNNTIVRLKAIRGRLDGAAAKQVELTIKAVSDDLASELLPAAGSMRRKRTRR